VKLFERVLLEQTIRGNRTYYHGGPLPFDISLGLLAKGRSLVYLTPDEEYATRYAQKCMDGDGDTGFIYLCKITRPLNIFNARSDTDRKAMIKYFRESEEWAEYYEEFLDDILDTLDIMKDQDWLESKGKISRHDLFRNCKTLGYDGVFNFETHMDLSGRPAIGLFVENDESRKGYYSIPHPDVKILAKKQLTLHKDRYDRKKKKTIEHGGWIYT